ncbi:hypothetical protein [Arthrobacter psychrolactophilus]
MLTLTHHLVAGIKAGNAADLDLHPQTPTGQAKSTWREYVSPLKVMGLAVNNRGVLSITDDGARFIQNDDPLILAGLLAERVRLFAEVLELLVYEPLTVQEVNDRLVSTYNLSWKTEANIRVRMTWLEVLGLTEWLGERKQRATQRGREAFANWTTVSPESLDISETNHTEALPETPSEIASLLDDLSVNPGAHLERSTYNIWVPSPSSDPNKIENMHIVISAAAAPITKDELLGFIAGRFCLKRSSVDSMLPFMRSGGFLQEVQRGVFVATSAAKAWVESGSEFNFVRLLHANMRFVGELVQFATENTLRNDIYFEAVRYGLNKEKARWIISFLLDAGLLIETSFASVQASAIGVQLAAGLPLAPDPGGAEELTAVSDKEPIKAQYAISSVGSSNAVRIAEALRSTAINPGADGKASGAAFEEAIREAFTEMGFNARRISGSGDTDVLVQWTGSDGEPRTAVIDGKSTSSGQVFHTNVSDVALETHREKNSADYVAVVGPAFGGSTIRSMAQKRAWALVTADELAGVVVASESLGLTPEEIGLVFDQTEGKSALTDLIETKERDLDIISLVISRLHKESEEDEPLSPRDISLIERASDINPSVAEVGETFELFERLSFGIVRSVEASKDARFATYEIGDARPAARRLRALADAIEAGLRDTR